MSHSQFTRYESLARINAVSTCPHPIEEHTAVWPSNTSAHDHFLKPKKKSSKLLRVLADTGSFLFYATEQNGPSQLKPPPWYLARIHNKRDEDGGRLLSRALNNPAEVREEERFLFFYKRVIQHSLLLSAIRHAHLSGSSGRTVCMCVSAIKPDWGLPYAAYGRVSTFSPPSPPPPISSSYSSVRVRSGPF